MEYRDFLGHEIHIGDEIVYTVRLGNCPILKTGTVVSRSYSDGGIPNLKLNVPSSKRLVTFSTLRNCVVLNYKN